MLKKSYLYYLHICFVRTYEHSVGFPLSAFQRNTSIFICAVYARGLLFVWFMPRGLSVYYACIVILEPKATVLSKYNGHV